jgi:hypothetical protein
MLPLTVQIDIANIQFGSADVSSVIGGPAGPRLRNSALTFWCLTDTSTSQETHYVSVTKPNRLMLFRETVAVYCENRMEQTDTLCGQTAEF